MIVCSGNVLTDHDVRAAIGAEQTPRTTGQVYGCLGLQHPVRPLRAHHPPHHGRGDCGGLRLLPIPGRGPSD
jgi:hypothetical protein